MVENREVYIPHLYSTPGRGWHRRNFAKICSMRGSWNDLTTVGLWWRKHDDDVKPYWYNHRQRNSAVLL